MHANTAWQDFKCKLAESKNISTEMMSPVTGMILSANVPDSRIRISGLYITVWILSFPACILLGYLTKWYIGVICIILIPKLIRCMIRHSATIEVLNYAAQNEEFFVFLVVNGHLLYGIPKDQILV
jgi:hypothetical protein